MNNEKIASLAGISLAIFGTFLLWLVNIFLGLIFTLFVLMVLIWYMKTKVEGNSYMKEVAKLITCDFIPGGLAYGRVIGIYRGHKLEIKVNKGYDSSKGLVGLGLSTIALNSVMGLLAGIENFTYVKINHEAVLDEPFSLDERTFVDSKTAVYLPPSNGFTGIPSIKPTCLVEKINEIIDTIEKMEENR